MSSQSIWNLPFYTVKNSSSEGIKPVNHRHEPDTDDVNQSPWLFTSTTSHYICIDNMECHKTIEVTKVERINTNTK